VSARESLKSEKMTQAGAPLLAVFEKACPEQLPKGGLPDSQQFGILPAAALKLVRE
jgi:hypothetical protein